ncbi:MAG: hypothetical protein Ct9H300mP1_06030 [Planctomycetaceae bacterium]|nr:MAG: hypothetical protein Ct9H300mP1_06030 [Planctomycetaceae bacterium]
MFFLDGGPSITRRSTQSPRPPKTSAGSSGDRNVGPGLQICDRLPLLAAQAHNYNVVRSLHHGNNSQPPPSTRC